MKYRMSKEMSEYIISGAPDDYKYPEPIPEELGAAYRIKSEKWKKDMSERMSGEGNPMWGKTTSAKQKKAVSIANSVPKPHLSKLYKERYRLGTHHLPDTRGGKNGNARAIIAEGVEYPAVIEAARALGVSKVTVNNRLKRGLYKYK